MSLHYIYSNASNSTLDITEFCRLYQYSATTDAKEGSVAHSTYVVDDPDGTLNFVGHRRLYTYEDLAPTNEKVVHNGYIFNEKVSRGPYRIGAGRIWTLDIVDTNALLNRRIMNGTDANRGAETDVARGIALQSMTELNTIDDFTYFSSADPIAMDAVDYRGQSCGTGYIDDMSQASGKNSFAWYNEALGQNSWWYDFAASSNWSSAIRLSNDLDDVDGTTTFAIALEQEAVLDRDPSRVASGIFLPYDGVAVGSNTVAGSVYVQNALTTARFGAIDWAAPSLNVKTKAKALARGNRYLADASEEDDLIHASVQLPSAKVNAILAGMRVEAKFVHFPGYESFRWFRVLSRTVTEISEDPTKAYRLDLELDPQPGAPQFAHEWGASVLDPDLPHATTPGSLLIAFIENPDEAHGGVTPVLTNGPGGTPWVLLESGSAYDAGQYGGPGGGINVSAWWRRVQPGEVTTEPLEVATTTPFTHAAWLWEYPGGSDPTGSNVVTYKPSGDHPSVSGAGGPVSIAQAGSYILGMFAVQLTQYGYGLVDPVTVHDGETLFNTDANLAVTGQDYPSGSQYIQAPWVWVGESSTGVLGFQVESVYTYNQFAVVGVAVAFNR